MEYEHCADIDVGIFLSKANNKNQTKNKNIICIQKSFSVYTRILNEL